MIAEAALEAAASVLMYHQRKDITSCMCGWNELGKSHAAHQAQLALEAAAPYMAVAAWNQGLTAGIRSTRGSAPTNPYVHE